MKIVCLVKQVPRPDSIEFDAETKSLRREGVPLLLNPFDAAAVAHAVAHEDAEVIAMTMGPPQAEAALRTCLAIGADRCVHLSDRVFAVADTLGTSRTLALAIQKEGDVDLVVCGRKTTDSETWQVPPETAAFLRWPHITSVVDTEVRDGMLRATRETDDGYETWEVPTPAVVSLAYGRDAEGETEGRIDVWTARDLVDDVRENDKRFGQTGSPTRVLAVRDVTPERAGDRYTSLDAALDRIRALAAERGPEPTSWDKPERLGEQPSPKQYDCWTFVELAGGRPARVSLELLAKGRELSGKLGGENVALVFGPDVSTELARHGADRIVHVDIPDQYDPELWTAALRQVVQRRRPHVLLIPATVNGRDLGPRVAGELELGMTGDCVGLNIDRAGRLIQTKPAYGGNIVSVIMGATTPQLATVRPRMFDLLEPRDVEARVERIDVEVPDAQMRHVDRKDAPARELDEADVIVCLGAELASDDIPRARQLAEQAGAAVGATRSVCERGDLPMNRAIGLFGRQVAPRLLVAVGVPGDVEEQTGFVKAGVVAAVNHGEAPMLDAADVGAVIHWESAIPAFAGAL
ncbi:MAG TPA: FAD-binding protein [Gaiellaceae bacterium]|nr:FAD-binding protein [Gaiellaceae bacterium]